MWLNVMAIGEVLYVVVLSKFHIAFNHTLIQVSLMDCCSADSSNGFSDLTILKITI